MKTRSSANARASAEVVHSKGQGEHHVVTSVVVGEGAQEGDKSEDEEDEGARQQPRPRACFVRLRYQCQVATVPTTQR